jgi:hypothetical protein
MVIHTCERCNFTTEYIWVYNSHLLSNKHIKLQTSDHEFKHTCKYCTKKYKSKSGFYSHKAICKKKPPSPENILLERITQLENQINQNKKVIPVVEIQYIYLVQEREFTKTGEPIYKIGKTKQENLTRFKQYSKGSIMLCQIISKDCDEDERILLSKFRTSYVPRKDVGSEYFEGDYEKMIQDIHETIFKK